MKLMLWNSFTSAWGMAAATDMHQRWALCFFFLLIRIGVLSCRRVPQPFDCGVNSIFREGTLISRSLLISPVSRTTPHGRKEAGRA